MTRRSCRGAAATRVGALAFALLVAWLVPCRPTNAQGKPAELTLTDTVSRHGITWSFSAKVRVGRFVNGDPYVLGPVTVASITPEPANGRNGSVLNVPMNPGKSGFDSRSPGGRYDPKLTARPPIPMKPGDILVSSISVEKRRTLPAPLRPADKAMSPVRSVSVLTCLAEAAPQDAFRPSYADYGKPTIYLARNLRRDLLPRLPRAGIPFEMETGLKFTLTGWADRFQRPWLDVCFFGFDAAIGYQPHYGREVGRAVGIASLLLCLDFTPSGCSSTSCSTASTCGAWCGPATRAGPPTAATARGGSGPSSSPASCSATRTCSRRGSGSLR